MLFILFLKNQALFSFVQEYWCKRLHPKNVCEKVYRQPPLRDSLKKGRLRKQDFAATKQKAVLLQAADAIGKRIQYNCSGFLHNRRQVIFFQEAVVEVTMLLIISAPALFTCLDVIISFDLLFCVLCCLQFLSA